MIAPCHSVLPKPARLTDGGSALPASERSPTRWHWYFFQLPVYWYFSQFQVNHFGGRISLKSRCGSAPLVASLAPTPIRTFWTGPFSVRPLYLQGTIKLKFT